MESRSERHDAFSLLELVFVVALLSIGIAGTIQAFAFSARMAGVSRDFLTAVLTAQEKAREMEFLERQGALGGRPPFESGETEKFRYTYTLTAGPRENLKRWDADLAWGEGEKEREVRVSTYLRV